MRYLRLGLVVVVTLVILLAFLPVVGTDMIQAAPVETAEDVFRVTAVAGTIGGERFDSVAQLEALLTEPIIGDTLVEINVTLQLKQPPPKYANFLRLRSGLTDVTWEATPAKLKGVVVWSYDGEETYLWVPPSHDVSEMNISLSGSMVHPIALTTFRTDEGATAERALIKEVAAEILLVEVRASRATFDYTSDPWAWVKTSVSESRIIRASGVATSSMIEQARTEIESMEQILAVLESPEVRQRLEEMPDEVGTMLKALVADIRDLVDSGAALIDAGYPDIFLMKAGSMRGALDDTSDIVARIRGAGEYEGAIAEMDATIQTLEGELGAARRNTIILGVCTGVFLIGAAVFFVMWRGVRIKLMDYLRG